MKHHLEQFLLATRWALLPLYLALAVAVVALYVMVGRELIHLLDAVFSAKDTEIVLLVLSILDLVLVANLLVMVALSSYETSISPLEIATEDEKPDWLGKVDSNGIKAKVSISIVMISAIHLLRAYMNDSDTQELLGLAAVHLVFVGSALALTRAAKH